RQRSTGTWRSSAPTGFRGSSRRMAAIGPSTANRASSSVGSHRAPAAIFSAGAALSRHRMADEAGVRARVGFASKTGPREANEDFAGALIGAELPKPRQEVVAAIADGIGGARGGRVAAETAVRGFLDGFCD